MVYKVTTIMEFRYLCYRLKTNLGIKSIGFGKYDGLVINKLLSRNKPSIYAMSVASTVDDLNTLNLETAHDSDLRLDKLDYTTICLHPNKRKVRFFVGENLRYGHAKKLNCAL